jgi:hypothetical protein
VFQLRFRPLNGRLAVVALFVLIVLATPVPRTAAQQVGTVQPGTAAIFTDKQQYNLGDAIQVCYRIPIAGYITITDLPSSQQTQVFYQGPSAGTGGCLPGTITPPAGQECLILTYPLAGGSGRTQTCFYVNGPVPPTGWIDAGAAQVDASGNFSFSGPLPVPTTLTFMRVTNAACTASPASNLVWEGALQRLTGTPPGADHWAGVLQPVGLAVSNGGSGVGHLSRPATANPVTQIAASLSGAGSINRGATFQVCLRTP